MISTLAITRSAGFSSRVAVTTTGPSASAPAMTGARDRETKAVTVRMFTGAPPELVETSA